MVTERPQFGEGWDLGELPPDVPTLVAKMIAHSKRLLDRDPSTVGIAAAFADRVYKDLLGKGARPEDVEPLAEFARCLRSTNGCR